MDSMNISDLWSTVAGEAELHEYLRFEQPPRSRGLLRLLRIYLGGLLRRHLLTQGGGTEDTLVVHLVLTLDGMESFTSDNPREFFIGLQMLHKASAFSVDVTCSGACGDFLVSRELDAQGEVLSEMYLGKEETRWQGFGLCNYLMDELEERFTYKLALYHPDSGESKFIKLVDGVGQAIEEELSPDILLEDVSGWSNRGFSLFAVFDFEAYPQVREELLAFARTHLSREEFAELKEEKDFYAANPEADAPGAIVINARRSVENLGEMQAYLDEINEILAPVLSCARLDADGFWENKAAFAYARIDCTEAGFRIVGMKY